MKYKLTNNTKECCGVTLYQIEATVAFGSVAEGELGGWIEKENNLSQEGDAWVYGDARVSGNAWVYGDAEVSGNAWVYGDAEVSGNAWVYGDAEVYGKLKLTAGLFFGVKWKGEKIQEVEIENGNYLIYKGEAKFGEEEKVEVTESTDIITLNGVRYQKMNPQ